MADRPSRRERRRGGRHRSRGGHHRRRRRCAPRSSTAAPDVVYHLAALASVGRSWTDPAEVLRVNAIGTLHVLEAARACPHPPRVLMTSSAEVYGAVPPGAPARHRGRAAGPGDPLRGVQGGRRVPRGPGPSGLRAAGAAHAALQPRGPRAVLGLRGVGPGASASSRPAAAAPTASWSGNLTARRDLTDVRDVVRAYRLLAERGVAGEVYNVCSGRDVAIAEVARQLQELAGVELRVRARPRAGPARRRPRRAGRLHQAARGDRVGAAHRPRRAPAATSSTSGATRR